MGDKNKTTVYIEGSSRKIKKITIIFAVLAVVSICAIAYVRMQKPEKMTVDETVQFLLRYIYDEDYFPLCTKYCSSEDGPLLTVYENIGYPAYEFDIPDSRTHTRVQVFCDGESENGEYLDLGVYIWVPNSSFRYERAELYSYFLVNRITKEVIQQREEDEEGYLVYDPKYYEFVKKQMITLDYYE